MLGNLFTQTIHVPGTLSANLSIVFALPVDCQLIHVSAVGSNNNDGLLTIGTTASGSAYLASSAIGDSNVPAEFSRASFVDAQYPHLAKGTLMAVALDFDGASGTATQNFTCVLSFLEG
mgnify:CR=1 FL=1